MYFLSSPFHNLCCHFPLETPRPYFYLQLRMLQNLQSSDPSSSLTLCETLMCTDVIKSVFSSFSVYVNLIPSPPKAPKRVEESHFPLPYSFTYHLYSTDFVGFSLCLYSCPSFILMSFQVSDGLNITQAFRYFKSKCLRNNRQTECLAQILLVCFLQGVGRERDAHRTFLTHIRFFLLGNRYSERVGTYGAFQVGLLK